MKVDKKIIFTRILIALAAVVFVAVFIHAIYYAPSGEINLPDGVKSALAYGKQSTDYARYPTELKIPAINVDAKVQDVGITYAGNMSTPNNYVDVGWFKYGALPGDFGSAVIAGHVDNGLALPAVFANLANLNPGDDIFLTTVSGGTLHFIVISSQLYDYKAPTADIFNENDAQLLKLITCAGEWVPKFGTHNKRLVVTAKLAS